ncbi:MAG: alpha-N-arabinofuranosidase [Bacteroides sp.]|nr:alpha-N-arabinofuranosidase [Bacteroides sp.]MCM1094960.1 alpha-N-arabinofuranosidase [Terasakiella sp.]
MKKVCKVFAAAVCVAASTATCAAAAGVTVTPRLDRVDTALTIPAEIYGQFAEHLGTCIYGGLWVGEDSPVPNTDGYRTDVLNALRELRVPVMRWPGGCFADEYHWTDGIGPRHQRPRMVNTNWGGTVEDNSFGTHEFFNLCELIGCEPYLSGNVGSGTVEELAKWVEYITAEDGPMAARRKANGREKPWRLKYLGVGNESWGCGGSFTPEAYANEYRRYQTYCRDFGSNRLYKIASGASDYDYNWTDVLMRNARDHMRGLSLHYYTVPGWTGSKGSATDFSADDHYWTMGKCLEIEDVIARHDSIMTVYDPERRVALIVDEWGTWWDQEPGTVPGHLYQQNTMRDALVAALSLNVFHRHTDRVRMANIAQIANVLQSMILTRGERMVLTPTYYVFKMYAPHQGATVVPVDIDSPERIVRGGRTVPTVSATASRKDGMLTVTLSNIDLDKPVDVSIPLSGIKARLESGEILTAADIRDYNDFGRPERVTLRPYAGARLKDGKLSLQLPAKSVVSLRVKL